MPVDCCAKLFAEIEAACAEAAADVQNRRPTWNSRQTRQMLDQTAAAPTPSIHRRGSSSVIEDARPQFVVIGADDVVVLDDLSLR